MLQQKLQAARELASNAVDAAKATTSAAIGAAKDAYEENSKGSKGMDLVKGGKFSLEKEAPGIDEIVIGLGWKPRQTAGQAFDLDASAFVLDENGKILSDNHFVFFNNPATPEGAVKHSGDNLTGEGDGDDEQLVVKLSQMPAEAKRIAIVVNIYQGKERGQNFGQVAEAYARVVDSRDNKELVMYELDEDYSTETGMVVAEVYNRNGEWRFSAVGNGVEGGLAEISATYGYRV